MAEQKPHEPSLEEKRRRLLQSAALRMACHGYGVLDYEGLQISTGISIEETQALFGSLDELAQAAVAHTCEVLLGKLAYHEKCATQAEEGDPMDAALVTFQCWHREIRLLYGILAVEATAHLVRQPLDEMRRRLAGIFRARFPGLPDDEYTQLTCLVESVFFYNALTGADLPCSAIYKRIEDSIRMYIRQAP